jgi:hypothetical protein
LRAFRISLCRLSAAAPPSPDIFSDAVIGGPAFARLAAEIPKAASNARLPTRSKAFGLPPGGKAAMDAHVDGQLSLTDQQYAIQSAEQTNNAQLVLYQKGNSTVNCATLHAVPLGQVIRPLILVEVASGTAIGPLVVSQKASDRHLVFCNRVYVGGVETRVAGFR